VKSVPRRLGTDPYERCTPAAVDQKASFSNPTSTTELGLSPHLWGVQGLHLQRSAVAKRRHTPELSTPARKVGRVMGRVVRRVMGRVMGRVAGRVRELAGTNG
jgi:hypothetical protein